MRDKITREITKEQYDRVKNEHNAEGIFTLRECMYGIYNEYYYQEDGKYYVSYRLGDSCD